MSNSEELCRKIQENESSSGDGGGDRRSDHEEDQSYAKSSLGVRTEDQLGTNKVLGTEWNVNQDHFQFDIRDVVGSMEQMEPTKQDVASATARFFDPLVVLSPVTIMFKMFCQQLFKAKIGWNDALTGSLLENWRQLLSTMKESRVITIPRCFYSDVSPPSSTARPSDSAMPRLGHMQPLFT